jgi:hypothetical protein
MHFKQTMGLLMLLRLNIYNFTKNNTLKNIMTGLEKDTNQAVKALKYQYKLFKEVNTEQSKIKHFKYFA